MNATPKKARFLLVATLLFGSLLSVANADLIITVDVSNPSAAIFSATPANSQNNLASEPSFNGVTLESFFIGNTVETALTPPTITLGSISVLDASGTPPRSDLERFFVDNAAGGWTPEDIGLYSTSGFNMQFSTTAQALSGSFTFDISPFNGLPSVSDTGNVFAGETQLW